MNRTRLTYCFSLFMSLALLILPLPLAAMAENVLLSIPNDHKKIIMDHADESYLYLGHEVSGISQLVSDLALLDNNDHSPIIQLKKHIDNGCNIAQYDAVTEVIEYMQIVLHENYNKLNSAQFKKIIRDIDIITDQINKGELTVHAHALELAHQNDKSVRGNRAFTNIMEVRGLLSVNDQLVQNITAIDMSVTDEIVQNSTITNLSVTDSIITNTTIGLTSVTDLVVTNIKATNVSVTDQTVTGTLSATDAVIDTYIRFTDTAGGEYVGLQAPSVVPVSYTVSLPTTSPTAKQVIRANGTTPTNLDWLRQGSSYTPASSNTIYVTKYGNDSTGDGSFDTPYLTLAKAIDVANSLASATTPVAIIMSAGVYTEDNSSGPLIITDPGISIVGQSASAVNIQPNTPANTLLLVNDTVRVSNVTFESPTASGTGVSLAAGSVSIFNTVHFKKFLVGVNCAGGALQSYGFNNCYFVDNGTALNINDTRVSCSECTVFGSSVAAGPAANKGISVTGMAANLVISGGVIGLCVTGLEVIGNAVATASGISFRINEFDIVQNTASRLTLSGCTFELTDGGSDIDVQVDGAGTVAEIIGCEFSGTSVLGVDQGVSIMVTNEGLVNISGGVMRNYTTGIIVGGALDTFSTEVNASGLIIRDCITDILQEGTTTLLFNSCTASSSKISINDATNVEMAFFDLDDNGALTIGSTADQDTILVQADIDPTNHPGLNYKSSLYSTQAIGFDNTFGSPSSLYSLSADNADLTSVTTDRTKTSGLRLVSDTGSPLGGTSALRGWDVEKNSTSGELSFTYRNSDLVGQTAVSPFVVMQLDGFNNQLQLPATGTQILFAGDTNLYRDSANVLKTDDNLIVGTLTPDRAVVTATGTNQLASSTVTGTELGYLLGVTSSIQTQLNGKVAKAGDIMTGALQLPAGTTALPSLIFTGSTTTGLSAPVANSLSLSTNAVERMKIGSTGTISINAFGTAGVVHNDASGNLSSSLIVDGDITNATISNAKLATISSANTSGNIVVRDGSGNFAANMITLNGSVVNNTDAATKAYVDSVASLGLVAKNPAVVVSTADVALTGLLTIDGVTLVANDRVLLVNQTDPIENGLWLAQAGSWTRPADFASGTAAGQAYVLITSGTVNVGSSYLCNTPTAIIDTDPIEFALFSLPDVTTGANVGTGTGQVYQGKTGITLNFRTLLADTHMAITNNANDITIGTDATSVNTPSTIVARDGSGNFSAGTITASLTGAASENVLKIGDTMTGALQLPAGTTLAPSLVFTGSTTSGLSASSGDLSFSTNALERLKIANGGTISINAFGTAGVVHNDASGNLSSSLIVNADVDPAAAIVDTKLATISTAGKVANSATTATNLNNPSTIVLRDGSGNFAAGTITASLTGAASANVLKAGDTMTGTLQLPAGTTALPSLVFTGSTTSGLSTSAGDLSFSTDALERLKIASGGAISINAFTTAGVVHNDASGNLSSSLIVNADVAAGAAIIDTKLATISTAGKVANSATTATSGNTVSTIVLRDPSGNFSAGAVSMTDAIIGNLTVTNCIASACVTSLSVIDQSLTGTLSVNDEVLNGTLTMTALTPAGVVHNDANGLLSSSLIVNADVSASAAIVDTKLATISTPLKVSNSATTATSANTASAIVARDGSGNFSAGTITASLTGAASANVLKAGDTMTGTLIMPAGSAAAPSIQFTGSVNTGFSAATLNTLSFATNGAERMNINPTGGVTINAFGTAGVVHNNASGLLSSSLIVNADIDAAAAIADTKLATISTAGKVANSATTATSADSMNTIVLRDASGNFATNMITLNGTVTNPTDAATKAYVDSIGSAVTGANVGTGTGLIFRDKTGSTLNFKSLLQGTHVVITNNANDITLATDATSANTVSTIVARDGSGNFSAGAVSITDGVVSSALTITPFMTAGVVHNNASGLLSSSLIVNADIDAAAAIVDTKLATISTAGKVANTATTATSADTASTIVLRDGSNNFATNMITLNGTTTNATDAATKAYVDSIITTGANVGTGTGLIFRDKTGNNINFKSLIQGSHIAITNNADDITLATDGTNLNTFSTLVARDAAGNFAASIVSVTDAVASGNLVLSTEPSTSTNGNILKGSNRFIHDYGTDNTFVGIDAGNFSMTGDGSNTAMGTGVLTANTTGAYNTGVGARALNLNTIGTDNVAIGSDTLSSNTTGINNVAIGSEALVDNVTGSGNTAVGRVALSFNDGNNNTAVGSSALENNTTGDENVALGVAALQANTTGFGHVAVGFQAMLDATSTTQCTAVGYQALQNDADGANTAIGVQALQANTTGLTNTAVGHQTLQANTTGSSNTALGHSVLTTNIVGGQNTGIGALTLVNNTADDNTAVGALALNTNSTGARNTAVGVGGLQNNTTGQENIAVGFDALLANVTGSNNVALGRTALSQSTGDDNIAIGDAAGQALTAGSGNIYIGADAGAASESNTVRIGTSQTACYIQGIDGVGVSGNGVVVDSNGQLGITTSSKRFKHNIADMAEASAQILNLRPVTFAYNNDVTEAQQFGLIAEEVDQIFPAIVSKDEEGQPYTVRYHLLPVLLLNELQKQHDTIEAMKQQYVTVEEMNKAMSSLQAEINNFMDRGNNGEVNA